MGIAATRRARVMETASGSKRLVSHLIAYQIYLYLSSSLYHSFDPLSFLTFSYFVTVGTTISLKCFGMHA